MMLHYRERNPVVRFTFICVSCGVEFKDTAPTPFCDRCDGGPRYDMGGE